MTITCAAFTMSSLPLRRPDNNNVDFYISTQYLDLIFCFVFSRIRFHYEVISETLWIHVFKVISSLPFTSKGVNMMKTSYRLIIYETYILAVNIW